MPTRRPIGKRLPSSLEFFGNPHALRGQRISGADSDGLLVANADDDRVMRHAATFAGRVRTFGVERPADVRALAVRDLGIDGTVALVRTPVGEAEIRTPLPGSANLANVLAATAVAIRFEVPLSTSSSGPPVEPVARRGRGYTSP